MPGGVSPEPKVRGFIFRRAIGGDDSAILNPVLHLLAHFMTMAF